MEQQSIVITEQQTENPTEKNWVFGLYIAHAISLFFTLGFVSFIPLILNYIKKEHASPFLLSHHSWQIRSFWWYLLWVVISTLMIVSVIASPLGLLLWGIAWLWKAYRILKGIIDLQASRPMPA